jgi:hypothetical protein
MHSGVVNVPSIVGADIIHGIFYGGEAKTMISSIIVFYCHSPAIILFSY